MLVLLNLVGHLGVHLWALVTVVCILDPMVLPMDWLDVVDLTPLKVGSLLVLNCCSIAVSDGVSKPLCGGVCTLHAV